MSDGAIEIPSATGDAEVFAAVDAALAAEPGQGEAEPESAPAEPPAAPAEEAKPDEKPAEEEKPKGEPDPFSEEALKTPEGVKAARAKLDEMRASAEARQRKLDKADIKFKARDREWATKRDEEQARLATDRATARALSAQLGLLKTGSATQILEVLGTLTGKPGRKIWEEMAQAALRDGKAPPDSPLIDELRKEIAELKEQVTGKAKTDTTAKQQEQARFVAQRKSEIVGAASDATKYPELAAYAAKGRTAEIVRYVLDLKAASVLDDDGDPVPGAAPLDDAACLDRIEAEIKAIKGQPTAGAAQAEKPEAVQEAAPNPGGSQSRSTPQSISPTATRSRSSAREMTEEERLEELRRNPEYVLSLFG